MTSASGLHPERSARFRRRLRALACLVVSGAVLAPRSVRAEDVVELRWSSPPGCPQAAAVQEQIRTIVGQLRAPSRLRAEGEITRSPGKYRLTLLVYDGNTRRERVIDSDSCASLAGAAAVALGLLLRGGTSGASSAQSTTGDADTAPSENAPTNTPDAKAARDAANSASAPGSARRRPPSSPSGQAANTTEPLLLILRAPIVALDAGLLPGAAFNAGAGIGLRYAGWQLGTSLRFFASETVSASQPSNVGASVTRIAADVWGCRTWSSGRFELGPCLTLGIDRFGARGTGPRVEARPRHFVALAPGAAVQAHLRATEWLALFVTAGAGIETSRARLTIGGGVGEVERLGSTRLTAGLGTEWMF